MGEYRSMGSMDRRHLVGSAMSTTTLHYQLRNLWRSPRGTVLRIEALALVAIALSFLVVAFGSCRRWSNSWFVQKGFLAAQVLSLSLGTYSIGLMQSSPVKSEMYPIWAVSLLTLFGCVDPITNYVGLDYKGPLARVIFQLCLYCGYVLVMSVSTSFSAVGNVAVCVLCAITFFKGLHRSLALLPKMRDVYLELGIHVEHGIRIHVKPETGALLAGDYSELEVLDTAPDGTTTTMDDVHSICIDTGEHGLVSIVTDGDSRRGIEDVCLGYHLWRLLQRHFQGLDSPSEMEEKRRRFQELTKDGVRPASTKYKRALKVIEVEMAFLYEVFFTSNEFLHMHDANAACFWALASFAAICFVLVVVAAIPGAMASRHHHRNSAHHGSSVVVDTTTADLVVTLVILVSLALLQLVQLILWWTSIWARAVFVIDYAKNRLLNDWRYSRIKRWWKRMKVRVVTRIDWFDKKHLWQDKLRQYSVVEACCSDVRERCIRSKAVTICCLYPLFVLMYVLPGMKGFLYLVLVLRELLLSNSSAGAAVKLHDDVKASITEFLSTIKGTKIGVEWSAYLLSLENNGLTTPEDLLQHLPYSTTALHLNTRTETASDAFAFTHRVMVWHIVTCYCEQVQVQEQADGRGDNDRRVAIALSKYCAYLVESAPELLRGPPAETSRAFKDAKRWTREALVLGGRRNFLEAWQQDMLLERQEGPDTAGADSAFAVGVRLGKMLLGNTRTTPTAGHWQLLARLWVQTLLYAAPYGAVQSHMQHLSQGGEFISHLWALLYHLGIDGWEREEAPHQPAAPPPC